MQVFEADPDFIKYLSLVLSNQGLEVHLRQVAGLTLKAQLDKDFCAIPMTSTYYIQGHLQRAFHDADATVRKTVANVMAVIMAQGGFNVWQDLPRFLTDNVRGYPEQGELVLTSIETLAFIVEDCTLHDSDEYALVVEYMFNPVCALIQRPASQTYTPLDMKIKSAALNTVNMLLMTGTESVT